jgi:hypothetical protein
VGGSNTGAVTSRSVEVEPEAGGADAYGPDGRSSPDAGASSSGSSDVRTATLLSLAARCSSLP